MGDITLFAKKVVTARYEGTIVCQHCFTEYQKGHWVAGYYASGTSAEFRPLYNIDPEVCPLCRKAA